jgi:Bax protein
MYTLTLKLEQAHRRIKPFRVYLLLIFLMLLGLIILLIKRKHRPDTFSVKAETLRLTSSDQIQPVRNVFVKPILYLNVDGLDKLPVPKAKSRFIAAVLPSVLVAKHEINRRRVRLSWMTTLDNWSKEDSLYYAEMLARYRARNMDDLMGRMITLPNSLVLAQAAVESGWGKSRFFLAGNNLFGVWSYNANDPRIPALKARKDQRVFLRSYQDMSESIIHYHEILARSRAYKTLREARKLTENPYELVPHLKNFSERRSAYTDQLKRMIERNNLTQFDQYEIDPSYLIPD